MGWVLDNDGKDEGDQCIVKKMIEDMLVWKSVMMIKS